MGEGLRGHLGLFPHLQAQSKDRFVKNHLEGFGGTQGWAPGEARGPHTTKTMVRDNGGAGEPGGGLGALSPRAHGLLCNLRPREWGEKP